MRDRFRRVDTIFDGALDRPPPERTAWVERECGDDAQLRDEVMRLLRAHDRSSGILEESAVEFVGPILSDSPIVDADLPLVVRIGPFRIVREIGHGGMGTVFLAVRDDAQFQQRVALKLVRAADASSAFVPRFLEERRILAMLEHPGIARLLDGGVTPDGAPWFAMEVVEGDPIDRFCDARLLTVSERIALFLRVCDAVQFAHQHLVVHRDLKPANILVTPDGQVKLLDFGIARLLDTSGADEGASHTLTALNAMTPEYASPEQVRGLPVGTATDVYALGVLLYQLLAGVRPFDLRGRTAAEAERLICDTEPAAPSATFTSGRAAADDSQRQRGTVRRSTPDRLRRKLRGDLDLIILKTLSKEPSRRYVSAAALADDLRRYVEGLPISARPPGTTYRLRRFIRRQRGPVAAVLVLILLLAGAAVRERTLRARAEAEARKALAVEEFLVSVFDLADPFARPDERGSDISARTLLDRGAARLGTELDGEPAVRAELRGVLGRVFTSMGLFDRAVPLLEQALAERRSLYGASHPSVAEALDRLGVALGRQNRFDEAERLLREAHDMRRRVLGEDHPATAASLGHLAWLLQERNDLDGAEPLFLRAVQILETQRGGNDIALADALGNVALLKWMRGDYTAADSIYRIAWDIQQRTLGENHPRTAQTLHNMAQAAQMLGLTARADTLYRAALAAKRSSLGDEHPSVTINLNNLGRMLAAAGRADEAEPLIREALALDRRIFGDRHSYVGQSLNNLGLVLRVKGEFEEAERVYRESLALNRELFGDEHSYVALNHHDLASVLHLQGNLEEAVRLYRRSREIYVRLLGEQHASSIVVGNNLARALREAGRHEEAVTIFEQNLARLDPARGQDRGAWITASLGMGQILTARRSHEEARRLLEEALELARSHLGPETLRTAEVELALAECLLDMRLAGDATVLLERANATIQANRRAQPRLAAHAEHLARRLERERARTAADR